jgi:2-iminobutanoate/2-iminopropanoate deaminase
MNRPKRIETDRAPAAIGPYSQAIAAGDFLYTAGQIPLDPGTMEMAGGDVGQQTDLVLRNLAAVLEAGGSGLDRVVKTTVFLADMGDFAAMNEVYARHFGDHRPARSTVEAAALPKGALVEIDAVATRGA